MKKKVFTLVTVLTVSVLLSGCDATFLGNKNIMDAHYRFDTAICHFPDGTTATYPVKSWTDYADGEQIQIIEPDGTVHLVSMNYTELIGKKHI